MSEREEGLGERGRLRASVHPMFVVSNEGTNKLHKGLKIDAGANFYDADGTHITAHAESDKKIYIHVMQAVTIVEDEIALQPGAQIVYVKIQ